MDQSRPELDRYGDRVGATLTRECGAARRGVGWRTGRKRWISESSCLRLQLVLNVNTLPNNGHLANSVAPERTPSLVPPHVAWPIFIVLLLAMSAGAALFTAYMANVDGGVQVVEGSDYSPDADR